MEQKPLDSEASNNGSPPSSIFGKIASVFTGPKKASFASSTATVEGFRVPTAAWNTKPPCAVIATFFQHSSYDALFREIQQVSPDPDNFSIAVFSFSYSSILEILTCLKENKQSQSPLVLDLLNCIAQVDRESVVFNFECCSNCTEGGLGSGSEDIIPLLDLIIQRGNVAVFGDFSLKGLIHDWSVKLLGPNPFLNIGSCDSYLTLNFNPADLIACSNAQLQTVGRMCDTGLANLHALGGTIVYTLNPKRTPTKLYELKVLTIVTKTSFGSMTTPLTNDLKIFIGDHSGTAGHVEIKYATGGLLITSAGHWIELSRVHTSEESLMRTMEQQMGKDASAQAQTDLQSCSSTEERDEVVQRYARLVVQSSAPCQYSSARR